MGRTGDGGAQDAMDPPGRAVFKGRGATANPPSRYLARVSVAVDDGWQTPIGRPANAAQLKNANAARTGDANAAQEKNARAAQAKDGDVAHETDTHAEAESAAITACDADVELGYGTARVGPDTRLSPDRTVTLITRNQSPDVPFDRSINPYKGCEHGCVYCFARPTHAYLDLSPGLDFETRIFYKTGVRERLVAELGKPSYRCAVLALGTNTDPYQPAERTLRITRTVLEVLREHGHPVSIVTKGQLILRDLDILADMAARGLASVAVSVTTLDRALKTTLEPRTADPAARLRMIKALASAGVPTRVLLAPVIPFVNDHEIERIAAAAAAAGAARMSYILLRLPLEVAGLFRDWLSVHYPDRAERVMAAIRDARGGRNYDATWGKRMRGEGPIADLIARRFEVAIRRHGLAGGRSEPLRTDRFEPPGPKQRGLFD